MIRRNPGEYTTYETRGFANESVDRRMRYEQVLECLRIKPMTAKEVAVEMMNKGYIPTSERNFTAPRLTELSQRGLVEPIGKTQCQYTGKTVAVYALRSAS